MGVRRLFSRGGQNFPRGGGQKHSGGGEKVPLLPSPADAHAPTPTLLKYQDMINVLSGITMFSL